MKNINEKKQSTPSRILESAHLLMWRDGYNAVTVDVICKRANVLKGSFYHFFASKEQLLLELLSQAWEAEKFRLDRIYAEPIPMLDRLWNHLNIFEQEQRKFYEQYGEVLGSFYLSLNVGLPEEALNHIQLNRAVYDSYLYSALKELVNQGLMERGNLNLKVKFINFFIMGALSEAKLSKSLQTLTHVPEEILRMLGIQPIKSKPQRVMSKTTTNKI